MQGKVGLDFIFRAFWDRIHFAFTLKPSNLSQLVGPRPLIRGYNRRRSTLTTRTILP